MRIAAVSQTFCSTPELVEELGKYFSNIQWNPGRDDHVMSGDELIAFIGDAEGAIIALEEIDAYVLDRCPKLKIIGKYGVGLNNIDIDACKERGVTIGWTGGTNKLSVAEMTLSFMIALSRNLYNTSVELKRGIWNKNGGVNLSGRTIGIIGVGNIGKEVIRLLAPFHSRILVNDVIDQDEYYASVGVESVSKEELFAQAEIITIHTPLTPETTHLINEDTIAQMRDGAIVINTARGPLVEYGALKRGLLSKKLGGVATDVYSEEPPQDKELIGLPNLFCTPHIGGNSKESVIAMGMAAIEHLKNYYNTKK